MPILKHREYLAECGNLTLNALPKIGFVKNVWWRPIALKKIFFCMYELTHVLSCPTITTLFRVRLNL